MKIYTIVLLYFLSSVITWGQFYDNYSETYASYTPQMQLKLHEFTQEFRTNTHFKSGNIDTLMVTLHFVRQDDGSGQKVTLADIETEMAIVNTHLGNADIYLKICPAISNINSSALYNYDHEMEEDILQAFHTNKRSLALFITDTINLRGRIVGGFGNRLGIGGEGVVMDYDLIGNGTTLVHEFGHVFHLIHTHGRASFPDAICPDTWSDPYISVEYWCHGAVNDTGDINFDGIPDCAQTGDDICDTPAQPNLYADSLRDNCVYIGTLRDINGVLYNPTMGNFMAYGGCGNHFTTKQYAKMRFALDNFGLHLIQSSCTAEDPELTVTNTNNSDVGSLRWAILCANHQSIPTTINFDIPGNGPHIIQLENNLESLVNEIIINGSSQPQGEIILDGTNNNESYPVGFYIKHNTIEINNITIQNFGNTGIYNGYEFDNIVLDHLDVINCGSSGIFCKYSENILISNCNIEGVGNVGIYVIECSNIDIHGNTIFNGQNSGIYINKSTGINIGSADTGTSNKVYGNFYHGIVLTDSCTNAQIINNYLGTDETLDTSIGNGYYGINLSESYNIKIGNGELRNYCYGNHSYGIRVNTCENVTLESNEVMYNQVSGIYVNNSDEIKVGTAEAGNVSSGSEYHGINIKDNTGRIEVYNNIIGLNPELNEIISNNSYGLAVDNCHNVQIGGAGIGNIIGGSKYYGIEVDLHSTNTFIQGNAIGTNFEGTENWANNSTGIKINASSEVFIGGDSEALENTIAFNPWSIRVEDTSINWHVQQNSFFCSEHGIYIEPESATTQTPEIDSITNSFDVYGKSAPGSELWFYKSNLDCNNCEGEYFLGKVTVNDSVWKATVPRSMFNGDKITVLASNSGGCSQFSECYLVEGIIETISGSQENNIDISFYPNPANQYLFISNKMESEISIVIVNLQGQKVFFQKSKDGDLKINVSDWEEGYYIVRVSTMTFKDENALLIVH